MQNPNESPVEVLDGIVDQESWDAAPVKVLWLLREVHDVKQEWAGDGGEGLRSTLRA